MIGKRLTYSLNRFSSITRACNIDRKQVVYRLLTICISLYQTVHNFTVVVVASPMQGGHLKLLGDEVYISFMIDELLYNSESILLGL